MYTFRIAFGIWLKFEFVYSILFPIRMGFFFVALKISRLLWKCDVCELLSDSDISRSELIYSEYRYINSSDLIVWCE